MTGPGGKAPEDLAGQRPRIVVGVDGSEASATALAWAVRQARLTGAVVEAVTAWEFPDAFGVGPLRYIDYEGMAAKALNDAVAKVGGTAEVRPRVVEGHPARVLTDASAGAEMLVVGSRGHGGFVGALLGSVSQHCVHYAHCPVVVIRPGMTPGAGRLSRRCRRADLGASTPPGARPPRRKGLWALPAFQPVSQHRWCVLPAAADSGKGGATRDCPGEPSGRHRAAGASPA